jgi:RNA recognition motif-containing protein
MNIYVGNIAFDATEENLRDAFAQYGEVTSAKLVMDRDSGRPRGFGFVEMPNNDEANAAIEALHQSDMMGRSLNVSEARPRNDNRGGGGGRGRW